MRRLIAPFKFLAWLAAGFLLLRSPAKDNKDKADQEEKEMARSRALKKQAEKAKELKEFKRKFSN